MARVAPVYPRQRRGARPGGALTIQQLIMESLRIAGTPNAKPHVTPTRQRAARRSNGPPARLRTAITASRGAGSMEMHFPLVPLTKDLDSRS